MPIKRVSTDIASVLTVQKSTQGVVIKCRVFALGCHVNIGFTVIKMSYLQSLGAFTGRESIFNTLATLTVMETPVRPDFVVISGQGYLRLSRTIQSIPCSHTHSFSAVQVTESLCVISGDGHALINLS